MLYEEFEALNYQEQEDFINSIDASTSEGRKIINDIIHSYKYPDYIFANLIQNVPTLTEDDLYKIFDKFLLSSSTNSDVATKLVTHPSFSLSLLNRIISRDIKHYFKNSVLASAAKLTENEDIYNTLFALNKKFILNACKRNKHFVFHEQEVLPEEVKVILFVLERGNISEDTGIEMIDKFNLHNSIIKSMLKMNAKWREHILANYKLDFGNVANQLAIAKNDETDEDTLYELSLVATNNEVRKAILAHHNCMLNMARNMFN